MASLTFGVGPRPFNLNIISDYLDNYLSGDIDIMLFDLSRQHYMAQWYKSLYWNWAVTVELISCSAVVYCFGITKRETEKNYLLWRLNCLASNYSVFYSNYIHHTQVDNSAHATKEC